MRDLSLIASLITIAKETREMGYSPEYLKVLTEASDEEHAYHLEILQNFDLVYEKPIHDMFGVYQRHEVYFRDPE